MLAVSTNRNMENMSLSKTELQEHYVEILKAAFGLADGGINKLIHVSEIAERLQTHASEDIDKGIYYLAEKDFLIIKNEILHMGERSPVDICLTVKTIDYFNAEKQGENYGIENL